MARFISIIVVVVAALVMGRSTPSAAQTTHTVNLSGGRFTPANLTIDMGDTVRWVWVSGFHDVESGTSGSGIGDGKFSSGSPVFPPSTFEKVFDQEFLNANPIPDNVYPYYCSVHFFSGMTGTIKVVLQGDLDRNGRIDLADHKVLRACLVGPGASSPPKGCSAEQFEAADMDGDGDVDFKDFATFQKSFAG